MAAMERYGSMDDRTARKVAVGRLLSDLGLVGKLPEGRSLDYLTDSYAESPGWWKAAVERGGFVKGTPDERRCKAYALTGTEGRAPRTRDSAEKKPKGVAGWVGGKDGHMHMTKAFEKKLRDAGAGWAGDQEDALEGAQDAALDIAEGTLLTELMGEYMRQPKGARETMKAVAGDIVFDGIMTALEEQASKKEAARG